MTGLGELNHVVCVYGTLRRGLHNHDLLDGAEFVAEGWLRGYAMFRFSSIPVAYESIDESIYVEAYRVDSETLARIDELENHPRMYRRTRVMVSLRLSDAALIEVPGWIYLDGGVFGYREDRPRIESGDFKEWGVTHDRYGGRRHDALTEVSHGETQGRPGAAPGSEG